MTASALLRTSARVARLFAPLFFEFSGFDSVPLVGYALAYVGYAVALVGGVVALVGY